VHFERQAGQQTPGRVSGPAFAVVPVVWTSSGKNKLRLVAG
jgi:hypothetical protein